MLTVLAAGRRCKLSQQLGVCELDMHAMQVRIAELEEQFMVQCRTLEIVLGE